MSRNGSGVYSLPTGNPVVTGTTISSSWANTTLNDIATALTGSVSSDGQTPVTGNINMNSNQFTNLAPGSTAGNAVEWSQFTGRIVQAVTSQSTTSFTTSSGTYVATGHTATITPTSASSKILVLLTATMANDSTNSNTILTINRGSTSLSGGGTTAFCDLLSSAGNIYANIAVNYLDTPSTTSPITYQPYIAAQSGSYGLYNDASSISSANMASLTLLEIL